MQLTEQYRPRSFDDVVGQDKIIQRIHALSKRGLAGRAYWLSGQSGTGKTTIGRLIAQEVAGEPATNEVNARDVDMEYVQTMERQFSTRVLARDESRQAAHGFSTKRTYCASRSFPACSPR